MKRKCAIFDLDGVIHNTRQTLTKIYESIFSKYQVPVRITDELLRSSPNVVLKQLDNDAMKKFNREYNTLLTNPILYDDVIKVIVECHRKNFILALITSQPKSRTEKVLKSIVIHFDKIYTWQDTMGKRFHAHCRIISEILDKFKISKRDAFYVTDSPDDIKAANSVGIKSVWVSWGLFSELEIVAYEPGYIVSKTEELNHILIT